VYYQNLLTEPLVVYASLSVHVISSLGKRALRLAHVRQKKKAADPSSVEGYVIREENDGEEEKKVNAKRSLIPISTQSLDSFYFQPSPFTPTSIVSHHHLQLHQLMNSHQVNWTIRTSLMDS
jgi:hypothetical protein